MATATEIRAYYGSDSYLARNAIIPIRTQIVASFLAGVRNSQIVDLGCGDGRVSLPLAERENRLTLVDFSSPMLDRARALARPDADVEFVEADILDYRPVAPLDVVIMVGVLAHVPSPEVYVAHAARMLRPNGLCVIQITDADSPLARVLRPYRVRRRPEGWSHNEMTQREIIDLSRRHDLELMKARSYGTSLPGLKRIPFAITRRLEAAAARRPLARIAVERLLLFRRASR